MEEEELILDELEVLTGKSADTAKSDNAKSEGSLSSSWEENIMVNDIAESDMEVL